MVIKMKIEPKNFEKSKNINVIMIEMAKNL